jgi:hypothetical protein
MEIAGVNAFVTGAISRVGKETGWLSRGLAGP